MTIGYRPKGEAGPAYHPERDYAYITPTLMKAAIERLESPALSEEVLAWKQENQITEADIVAVVDALAFAQRDFINASDPVSSMEQALTRRGFYDVRYPVRQFLFATIGEVFCAAWFTAVREVTHVNEASPAAPAIAEFMAAVRGFVGLRSSGILRDSAVADLQLRNDLLQSRLNTVYSRLREVESLLAQTKAAEVKEAPVKDSSWFRFLWTRK